MRQTASLEALDRDDVNRTARRVTQKKTANTHPTGYGDFENPLGDMQHRDPRCFRP